jgi:hypothetical protein
MSVDLDQDVFSDALSLPAKERSRLAQELTEIERRARDVEARTAELSDWSAVRARLETRWRKR